MTRSTTRRQQSQQQQPQQQHGPTRLNFGGFWMPSYCPRGLRGLRDRERERGSVMVDAAAVDWDGNSKRCTAHYVCDVCGHRWSESDWPAKMFVGLGRKDGKAA